jgi:hypothetical protein
MLDHESHLLIETEMGNYRAILPTRTQLPAGYPSTQ